MLSLKIRNYQRIKSVDFEADGITLITGGNNQGKTSLVRALNSLIFNTAGNRFIRGKSTASVKLDFKGLEVEWGKTGSSAFYKQGEEVNEKLGRGTNLKDLYPLTPLFILPEKHKTPHIQFTSSEPIFPFYLTSAEMFSIFDFMMKEISLLKESQKIVKSDVQENKKQLMYLSGSIDTLSQEIGVMEQIKKKMPDLDTLKSNLSNFERLKNESKEKLTKFVRLKDLMEEVDKEPDLEKISEDLTKTSVKLTKLENWKTTFSKLESLSEAIIELEELETKINTVDLDSMKENVDKLEKWQKKLKIIKDLGTNQVEFKELEKEIEENEIALNSIRKELGKIKICPLCERPLEEKWI